MMDFDKAIDCCFCKTGNSTQIADWFIRRAFDERDNGTILTQLKLQKLLYYAYVWWLVLSGNKLFDDNIEAWEYGPVVRTQYARLKKYNEKAIKLQEIITDINEIPQDKQQHLEKIWQMYGKYDVFYLVNKTHNEQPWRIAFNQKNSNGTESRKKFITDDMITDYYTKEMFTGAFD